MTFVRHRPERGRAFEWTDTAAGASYGGWPRPAPPAGESPAPPSLCAETHRARNARPLHARGRYTCTVSTFVSIGSSPHARDRRHLDSQYLCLSRFIPACAESTFTIHRPAHGCKAVHPCARESTLHYSYSLRALSMSWMPSKSCTLLTPAPQKSMVKRCSTGLSDTMSASPSPQLPQTAPQKSGSSTLSVGHERPGRGGQRT